MLSESQNIEYKESWNDKYLQWICGFANTQGGRIYIGVNYEIDGGVSVWIKRFSLEELVIRNKKLYGDKAPNMNITDMNNVGNKKNHRKRFSSYV